MCARAVTFSILRGIDTLSLVFVNVCTAHEAASMYVVQGTYLMYTMYSCAD